MPRYTKPRRRPMRDKFTWKRGDVRVLPPNTFWMTGYPVGDALHPRRVTIRWEAGQLSGDTGMVAAALERAVALEGHHVGPVEGPVTNRNHLADALSALFILLDLFIPGTVEVSGDVPVRPPIPEGAKG